MNLPEINIVDVGMIYKLFMLLFSCVCQDFI